MTQPTPTILILGATSEIGTEIAKLLAPGHHFILASRRPTDLTTLAEQLTQLGATGVETPYFDAEDLPSLHQLIHQTAAKHTITHAIVCFGILGNQHKAETNWEHAAHIATTNYTAQIVALTTLRNVLQKQHTPATITAFSSIAGWRARRANYVYGSTKAGLDAFCQGFSDSLHGSGVKVIIARPGFVIGSMTAGMTPAPLSVTAIDVAQIVVKKLKSSTGSTTVWIPARLRFLAWLIKAVPRPLWRKMPR